MALPNNRRIFDFGRLLEPPLVVLPHTHYDYGHGEDSMIPDTSLEAWIAGVEALLLRPTIESSFVLT